MQKVIIAVMLFILVACSPPAIKPLATKQSEMPQPTATITPLPTLTETEESMKLLFVNAGNWNMRGYPSEHGKHKGYAYNGTFLMLVGEYGEWYEVKTVEENPDDVVFGWIKRDCCK